MQIRLVRRIAAMSLAFACVQASALQLDVDVPFITSPDNVTLEMLNAAKVGPGDYVLDLGSGDGRIVITAAKRFGASGMGVEIVPDLVEKSNRSAKEADVADRVSFRVQDLFKTDLTQATVITMYLLPEVNLQLRPRILKLAPGTRIVSHDWDMADWKPDRTISVDAPEKNIGLEKKSRLHLWIVPADFAGRWCSQGKSPRVVATLTQTFQWLSGEVGDATTLTGTVTGRQARLGGIPMRLEDESRLHISGPERASGAVPLIRCAG